MTLPAPPPRSKRIVSYAIWGAMLLAFLVFELLGLTHKLPWVTASETDWATLRLLPTPVRWGLRALLLGFFLSLGPHLAFATPLLP